LRRAIAINPFKNISPLFIYTDIFQINRLRG
jgi:hypothetical protein